MVLVQAGVFPPESPVASDKQLITAREQSSKRSVVGCNRMRKMPEIIARTVLSLQKYLLQV